MEKVIETVSRIYHLLPRPTVFALNLVRAIWTLGVVAVPLLVFLVNIALSSLILSMHGLAALAFPLSQVQHTALLAVTVLVVLASLVLASFLAVFVLLLESSPPDSAHALPLARYLLPVYAVPLTPLLVSHVLAAPALTMLACALLSPGLLSWEHFPEVSQLMVMFVRAKVNSRGRTREMLDAIMGRVRPSVLLPPLALHLAYMGLANNLTRQGLDALFLGTTVEGGQLRDSSSLSPFVRYVVWPLLFAAVYLYLRAFVLQLAAMSGDMVYLSVRATWLTNALEAYPGPWSARAGFVLRSVFASPPQSQQQTAPRLRPALKYLPCVALYLLYRGARPLSPLLKCASTFMLAAFGFYQSIGLLRFPSLEERRMYQQLEQQQLEQREQEEEEDTRRQQHHEHEQESMQPGLQHTPNNFAPADINVEAVHPNGPVVMDTDLFVTAPGPVVPASDPFVPVSDPFVAATDPLVAATDPAVLVTATEYEAEPALEEDERSGLSAAPITTDMVADAAAAGEPSVAAGAPSEHIERRRDPPAIRVSEEETETAEAEAGEQRPPPSAAGSTDGRLRSEYDPPVPSVGEPGAQPGTTRELVAEEAVAARRRRTAATAAALRGGPGQEATGRPARNHSSAGSGRVPATSTGSGAGGGDGEGGRGMMDGIRSLIANSANIPRSLSRVHEAPESSSQRVLLALHMMLRGDEWGATEGGRAGAGALSAAEVRRERRREELLVHRFEVMFEPPPFPVYAFPRMSPAQIDALPLLAYTGANPIGGAPAPDQAPGQSGPAECCVCLEDIQTRQSVLAADCGHVFHRDCLIPWLRQSCSCPLDRCEISFACMRQTTTAASSSSSFQGNTWCLRANQFIANDYTE